MNALTVIMVDGNCEQFTQFQNKIADSHLMGRESSGKFC